MKIINWILSCFQHCCICSSPTFQISHLCNKCQSSVGSIIAESYLTNNYLSDDCRGFLLISLGSYRNIIFRKWIMALKGGDNKKDFKLVVFQLIKKRQTYDKIFLKFPVLIVPAPSRVFKRRDHSSCLAEALSLITGWELANILVYDDFDQSAQKTKGALERENRKFKASMPITGFNGTLIFVDDVVTTGSTAVAAWNALGKPRNFEVWCIAHQPLLARLEKS